MQIHGYRIKTPSVSKIETVLLAAKNNVREAADQQYHELLSEEVCTLVDGITLNIYQRPPCSIFDEAVRRLNDKINRAEMTSSGTEYDLRAGVSIIPDGNYTYLMFSANNPALEAAFASTKQIEPYAVSGDDLNSDEAKKWEAFCERYHRESPMLSASLTSRMSADIDKLTYASPMERAQTIARHNLTRRLLNQYACGKEIQQQDLMSTLDKALSRLVENDQMSMLNEMTMQLSSTLIEITKELVEFDPSKPKTEPIVGSEETEENSDAGE